ncbi:hypothetical protein IV203_012996 [Nitzschia inconspicua]|uniref:Uncharacterized protein n=1 Tax=Nitzschia inconspicua TaxID=303405 RepID=A0A9K3Q7P8_9STRA|nr:hypothetical protein IV203_012996 [Nitzschia inconspicua]
MRTATLPFSGFLRKPTDDVLMASFQDRHDLFSLTQTIYKDFIVRFDPQMFPVVPGGVAKNKDSIKKLFDALMFDVPPLMDLTKRSSVPFCRIKDSASDSGDDNMHG